MYSIWRQSLCYQLAVVAEWLRRLTRNQIPSGSVGSNPTDCVNIFSLPLKCCQIWGTFIKEKNWKGACEILGNIWNWKKMSGKALKKLQDFWHLERKKLEGYLWNAWSCPSIRPTVGVWWGCMRCWRVVSDQDNIMISLTLDLKALKVARS